MSGFSTIELPWIRENPAFRTSLGSRLVSGLLDSHFVTSREISPTPTLQRHARLRALSWSTTGNPILMPFRIFGQNSVRNATRSLRCRGELARFPPFPTSDDLREISRLAPRRFHFPDTAGFSRGGKFRRNLQPGILSVPWRPLRLCGPESVFNHRLHRLRR